MARWLRRKPLLVAAAALLFAIAALGALEASLRLLDWTRQRNSPLDFADVRTSRGEGAAAAMNPAGWLKPGFGGEVLDAYGGATRWSTNGQGFRATRDFTLAPAPGVRRILSIGDSTTVGFRIGQGDTYGSRIESWSNESIGSTEVLISFTQDLPSGIRYLQRFGMRWKPDLILMGLSLGNDLSATASRGEEQGEALAELDLNLPQDSRLGQPCWRTLARRSRLLRSLLPARGIASAQSGRIPTLFDPVHGLGFFLAQPPRRVERAYQRIYAALKEIGELRSKRDLEIVLLIIPQRFQVQPEDWKATVREYRLRPDRFDLNRPNQRIAEFCRRLELECLDATSQLRQWHQEKGMPLYQPNADRHWNWVGHRAFFNAVRPHLQELIAAIDPDSR